MRRRVVFALLLLVALAFALPAAMSAAQTAPPFRVYLAFEDGPTAAYTPEILDILAAHGAKASFLIAGQRVAGSEALIQREVREGHALVNHLWEETTVYAGAADAVVIDSYLRTEAAIRAALGDQLPIYDAQVKMFWQPGGGAHPLPAIDGVQVITYNWNVNSDDCGWGMPAEVDLETFEFDEAVLDNLLGVPRSLNQRYNIYDYGDGAIVSLHDLNRVTARILPTLLRELQAAGATFEALPRPGDAAGSMPVLLGVPPVEGVGLAGVRLSAAVLDYSHVRAAPDLNAPILETLPPGTSITALGRAVDWIQVDYAGAPAWIHRGLLAIHGPIPALPVVE